MNTNDLIPLTPSPEREGVKENTYFNIAPSFRRGVG